MARALGVAGKVNGGVYQVIALHRHMLTGSSRLFYLHFCTNDDAPTLARGLRAALDRTNSRRTGT